MIGDKPLGELTDNEVQFGETHFDIRKLPVMEGWHTLEYIRRRVGDKLLDIDLGDSDLGAGTYDAKAVTSVFGAILSMEETDIDKVRTALFKHVKFRNESAKDWQVLEGAEDMAFQALEPGNVYEVLVRCLVVNFFGSFQALARGFLKGA